MKFIRLLWLTGSFLLLVVPPALAQSPTKVGYASTSGGTIPVSAAAPLPVTGTFTPSATQDVNLTQVLGAAPSLTNPLWVFPATGATFAVSGTFWQTVQPVSLPTSPAIASGSGVVPSPSSAAAAGLANVVSTAAESNHVLKGSPGNLYTLTTTIGTTSGYLMLFDATTLPANGAVTPKYCLPITSNATNGGAGVSWPYPLVFATGITAGFSTTGCFTLTASATANFFGQVN